MRTLLLFLLVLALLAGAVVVYLVATTPKASAGIQFPITADQRALLARVPAGADAFALIPTAAVMHRKLLANPVTRGPVEEWTDKERMPEPWMLGGADILAWRNDKRTSYAIRVDPFRAFLVRIWMMWSSGGVDARWDGTAFVMNGTAGPPIDANEIEKILVLAGGLPAGDVFVVQRNRTRGAFPPIGRPAVSSMSVTAKEILTVSRAAGGSASTPTPINARFPKTAMLAVTFNDPPQILADLRRLTGTNVAELAAGGGSITIYDVDTGTLLPRPRGLIAVPASEARRAAMADVMRMAELVGQTEDTGKELLVAFDRNSIPLYLKDATVPASWPATSWAARIDPVKLVPVLEELGDSTGLRLASGRLHRAARDLRRWISALEQAESIEAAASATPQFEELRVRIASK